MYDDAFSLQKVDEELVMSANYVAGMVPFIRKLITDVRRGYFAQNAKNAEMLKIAF